MNTEILPEKIAETPEVLSDLSIIEICDLAIKMSRIIKQQRIENEQLRLLIESRRG
jgi:hypothetical protein